MINIVFNCDMTLTSIEGPVELAARMRVQGIDELTEQAMNGTVPFGEVFRKRFALCRPDFADIQWLGEQYLTHLTPGAATAVDTFHAAGYKVFIVSASFRTAILKVSKTLGIPSLQVCAVDIEFDTRGHYVTYDVGNILTTDEGLEIVLAEIAKSGPTVYVGDSVRDLDALRVVDCMVGYGGAVYRPEVERQAHHYIREPSLVPLVGLVEAFVQGLHQGSTPHQQTSVLTT